MISDFWYRIGIPGTMETLGDRMEQQQETREYNKRMERITLFAVFVSILALFVSMIN